MTITLKGLVSGTHKNKPVAFSITFPNVRPDDAAQAAFEHLNPGKRLKSRRNDWTFAQTAPRTYSLRWFDGKGCIEGDLTISIVGRADAVDEAAPTKGPIVVDERDGSFLLTADRSASDVEAVGIAYKRADADIFAASSVLLEALKEIIEAAFEDDDGDFVIYRESDGDGKKVGPPPCIEKAIAAIAKAEGRANG